MRAILFICGVYTTAFAVFHIFFWKLFDWKTDLQQLTFVNKGIIQTLNSRIIYFFLFMAFLCFFFPGELLYTQLGKALLMGNSLFWVGRTIEQFIFFRTRNIYLHILTIIFIIGAILFAWPVLKT